MNLSGVDWVVMWKLYHDQFFWIYLALGIPLRLVAARGFGAASARTNEPFRRGGQLCIINS